MSWHPGRITGYLDGKVVARRDYVADPLPTRLQIDPDMDRVPADPDIDLRVMLRALDQAGNRLPFLDGAVHVQIDGPAKLIGPTLRMLQGGTTGLWLRLTGMAGPISITARHDQFPEAQTTISVG